MQETFNKDLEELKRKQAMMNNTTNEIKNTLEGIKGRITEAKERISDLGDKIVEITTEEQNKYICTQQRTTSIHKATANSYKRGNRQ